ncbi:MAG: SOS response-associated peptidase [Gemmatimonadota bacterium]
MVRGNSPLKAVRMCGRFSLGVSTDDLVEEFGIAEGSLDWSPRFNIAPSQDVAAVVAGEGGPRIGTLRWGLVPHWADDPAIGNRLINARAESVADKPAFRDAFRARRCLILADGFYEWQRPEKGTTKVPVHVRLPDGRPFAFAGLWERWQPRHGEPLHTCTIITTDAAPSIRTVHDRMPVILRPDQRQQWIRGDTPPATLLSMLRPYAGLLTAHPVSTVVNSPDNDSPDCVIPVGDALT